MIIQHNHQQTETLLTVFFFHVQTLLEELKKNLDDQLQSDIGNLQQKYKVKA